MRALALDTQVKLPLEQVDFSYLPSHEVGREEKCGGRCSSLILCLGLSVMILEGWGYSELVWSDYGRLHCESRKREEDAVKMQQPQLIGILFNIEHHEAKSIIFQDSDRDIGLILIMMV